MLQGWLYSRGVFERSAQADLSDDGVAELVHVLLWRELYYLLISD